MRLLQKWFRRISIFEKTLIGLGAIGFLFIGFGDYLLWFDISAADKINSTVLLWTGIAVVWYTMETYDLRKSSEKQVLLQEKVIANEYMPVLMPDNSAVGRASILEGGLVNMFVQNLGNGLAKDIKVFIDGVLVWEELNVLGVNNREQIFIHGNKQHIFRDKALKKKVLNMKLIYQDINDRAFTTTQIIFKENEEGRIQHILSTSHWQFKEVAQ